MVVKEMEGFIKFPGIVPKVKMKGEKKKTKQNYGASRYSSKIS